MKITRRGTLAATAALVLIAACSSADTARQDTAAVSGAIEHGLRVLTIDPTAQDQHFRIYRGDYVRPVMTGTPEFTVEIPGLEVAMSVPVAEGERAYFKVPAAGAYAFTAGEAKDMLVRTKTYQLLKGVRGQEGVDVGAIAEGIQRLSQLVTAHPEIQEMDINPFVVGPEGVTPVAVDARISVEEV